MRTVGTLSLAAALLVTPLVSAGAALTDDALEKALEGAWCSSDDGGKTCWGYDKFSKGRIDSCGRIPGTTPVFTAQAKYQVRGNRMCLLVESATRWFPLRVGEHACMDILDINKRSQRFRDLQSGETNTLFRVPKARVQCPSE